MYCDAEKRQQQPKRKNRKEHEWAKHGTCSGLEQDLYFAEEARLMKGEAVKGLENALFIHAKSTAGQSSLRTIPVEDIVRGSERKVAVKAAKDCKLQELTVCFEKMDNGMVGKQIDCPDSIMKRSRHTSRCARVALETDQKCSVVEEDLLKAMLK